jgi:hypothetical protein
MQRANVMMDSSQYLELSNVARVDGVATAVPDNANYTFKCNNVSQALNKHKQTTMSLPNTTV